MDVFLSWSGSRSRAVAETLEKWLSKHLQAVEPWISVDIQKGARWGPQIAKKLEKTRVGIICLTPENLDSRWIHFEADALSKSEDGFVCTFLLDVSSTEVEPPLGQFQPTKVDKSDVARLLRDINREVERAKEKSLREQLLAEIIDESWPELDQRLREIMALPPERKVPARSEGAILDEILTTVRSLERHQLASEYASLHFGHAIKPGEDWREAISREAARKQPDARRTEEVIEELVQLVAEKESTEEEPAT